MHSKCEQWGGVVVKVNLFSVVSSSSKSSFLWSAADFRGAIVQSSEIDKWRYSTFSF